jgi:NitT/TauT family transport system substrate-binding protein
MFRFKIWVESIMLRFLRSLRFAARADAVLSIAGAIALLVCVNVAHAADKVNVGVLRFVSSGPLFLAVDRGYFRDGNIEVEMKYFEAAQPIAVAAVSGDIDFGLTAFTGGFYNLAGQGYLKIIAAQSKEAKGYSGNAILVSNAAWEKGFRSVRDFPGKSLGMTQVGASFHYQMGQLARVAGFDLKSVQLRALQSLPNMVAAIKGAQVDAIIIAPHLAKPLIDAGDVKFLGWYSDYDEYQFGGLFANTKTVQQRRELAQRFVKAYQKGTADYAAAFMQKDAQGNRKFDAVSDAAAKIITKIVYASEPEEKGVALVKASAFPADAQARLDVSDIYKQVDWMKAEKLVDANADAKSMLDLSFVDGHFNVPK